MLKKMITYTDYDGNERTEEAHFNLSKAELTEMEFSAEGGLKATIDRIIAAKDTPQIFALFKKIILSSYGVKSPDGRRLIKSKELSEEFTQTEAYSNLLMELLSDPDKMAKFIESILPADTVAGGK